ncbi:condensin complex subunit 2-like [Phymastichus coffea]|uniref:condensin complex subunit 2-like n=1 Tax=Phymastichus coffea TaxID=108790 RepID=UPI00273C2B57|nr:condensin complex subunit 2-like [Phymastichus coffea]
MSGLARKSLGAVRFDLENQNSPSTTISPSRRRRSIAAQKVNEPNIEENDDEAERLARRERNENGSPASTPIAGGDRRQSTFGLSAISNVSVAEMNNQIAQCIKLNAENKINDKNAFQLKMIDFLVYALKKQDPNMTNLQMASASLDASAKIYGFRVDKVHSDLLKIIGMVKQDKRDQDENNDAQNADQSNANKNEGQQKKKKKKNRQHIISTVEALKGNVENYDPLSLIRCQRDTQTSDMLFQAGLPQHANQGVALNLYNDILLDKVVESNIEKSSKMSICNIEDYTVLNICPSYAAFKFLDWSPDDEVEEPKSQADENDGEYHFDLDAAVPDDDVMENDVMMDCGDAYEERCDRLAQNNHNFENIVDFQEIIANNPNPNATYEYSYLQKSYKIHWAGPSHWKITLNKNLQGSRVVETCKQNATKKKKEIELSFTIDSKEEGKLKFSQINRHTKILGKTTKVIWSEDKVTFPEDIHYDLKRYYIFFNKPTEHLKFTSNERLEELPSPNDDDNFDSNGDHDLANFAEPDGGYFGDNNDDERFTQNPGFTQETTLAQSQGAFVGDNLVSVPKLTDKVFIPYSQRAKKIDMRQLKKTMWKNLKKSSKEKEKENFNITQTYTQQENEQNKEIEPKVFSDMYMELPKMLSKANADSLSPAIAFVSLLHLANEKNLAIERDTVLANFVINSGKNETIAA